MHENIETMINQMMEKDLESASMSFQDIIMDKVASRMEEMKANIARDHFNLGTVHESNSYMTNESVTPEQAYNLLKKHGVKPSDTYFSHTPDTRDKISNAGHFLGLHHNIPEYEDTHQHIWKTLTNLAFQHNHMLANRAIEARRKVEANESVGTDVPPELDQIDEAVKSTVRSGFDAKHAAGIMMEQGGGSHGTHNFFHNHFMYGVNSARRKVNKGTYDDSKLDKMGENLSKLGKWRVETQGTHYHHKFMPTNAAEHREVGKHIADHIRSFIGVDPKHHE